MICAKQAQLTPDQKDRQNEHDRRYHPRKEHADQYDLFPAKSQPDQGIRCQHARRNIEQRRAAAEKNAIADKFAGICSVAA